MPKSSERPLELAKLSIPFGTNRATEARWRFKLLKRVKLFDFTELCKDIEFDISVKNLPKDRRDHWINFAKSKEFQLDDIDKAVLYLAPIVERFRTSNDLALSSIDLSFFAFLYKTPKEIKLWQSNNAKGKRQALNDFSLLLAEKLLRIRAKLAALELVTVFSPTKMVPWLINITPRYLACDYVQRWIMQQQVYSRHGDDDSLRRDSDSCLKQIAKAISGDKRRAKEFIYSYWHLANLWSILSRAIQDFRSARPFNRAKLISFCKTWNFNCDDHKLILNPVESPKETALSLMKKNGYLGSPKAFRDFVSRNISSLNRIHSNPNSIPILKEYIDHAKAHPNIMFIDLGWRMLENIKL